MPVKSLCGVILVTENVAQLARFYADGLGLELRSEAHGKLAVHYGTDIGSVHFAIHPPGNFDGHPSRGTAIAFEVDRVNPYIPRLLELGATLMAAPRDEGFGVMARLRDPEGNVFELVELSYTFDDEATLN